MRIDPTLVRKRLADLTGRYDVIVAEGAGGLAVPLDDEGRYMQYDLIRDLNFPCLLVCHARLGTINHTLLTLYLAKSVGLRVKGIVVNRAGDSLMERDNIEMIKKLAGPGPVFTLPEVRGPDPEKLQPGELGSVFEQSISLTDVLALMERI
jgi:dethiobiotin synthetase